MVEILFSGLCLIQPGSTSARLLCPEHHGHAIRLTVIARQIETAPTDSATWLIGPDGTEYAAYTLTSLNSVEFQDAAGAKVSAQFAGSLESMVRASHLGRQLASSPAWKVEYQISEGLLRATDLLRGRDGSVLCFKVPEGGSTTTRPNLTENVTWSMPAVKVTIKFNNGQTITLGPNDGPVRASISNDVTSTTDPNPPPDAYGEFKHWKDVAQLKGNFDPPAACVEKATRRPICNLLRTD